MSYRHFLYKKSRASVCLPSIPENGEKDLGVHGVDVDITAPIMNYDDALHAKNEGMLVQGFQEKARPSVFEVISAYLRREYASLKQGEDLTLEQLLARLGRATEGDRLLRKQSASLMFLIASDIKNARDFPIQGISGPIARPLRAWRQRYNGLDRFLPRPS